MKSALLLLYLTHEEMEVYLKSNPETQPLISLSNEVSATSSRIPGLMQFNSISDLLNFLNQKSYSYLLALEILKKTDFSIQESPIPIIEAVEGLKEVKKRKIIEENKRSEQFISTFSPQKKPFFLILYQKGSTLEFVGRNCETAFKENQIDCLAMPIQTNLYKNFRIQLYEKLLIQIKKNRVSHILCLNFFIPPYFEGVHRLRIPIIIWVHDTPLFNLKFDLNYLNADTVFYLVSDESFGVELMKFGIQKNKIAKLGLAYNPKQFYPNLNQIQRYSLSFVGSIVTSRVDLIKHFSTIFSQELSLKLISELRNNGLTYKTLSITDYFNQILKNLHINISYSTLNTLSSALNEIHWEISSLKRLDYLLGLAKFNPRIYAKFYLPQQNLMDKYRDLLPLIRKPMKYSLVNHLYQETKINLNINAFQTKNFINMRFFDVLGSGGFLISESNPVTHDYFQNDRDVVFANSAEEFIDKVTYYLPRESLRRHISQNGYEKVKRFHTYAHRIQELLMIVSQTWGL